jgi:hypothetical protein
MPWTRIGAGIACRRILIVTSLLAACSPGALPPFDTAPKSAPLGVNEDFTRVGVCYNRKTATPQQVLDVARGACEPGTTPSLIEQDMELFCPILTPVRATFACLKPGMPPSRR